MTTPSSVGEPFVPPATVSEPRTEVDEIIEQLGLSNALKSDVANVLTKYKVWMSGTEIKKAVQAYVTLTKLEAGADLAAAIEGLFPKQSLTVPEMCFLGMCVPARALSVISTDLILLTRLIPDLLATGGGAFDPAISKAIEEMK